MGAMDTWDGADDEGLEAEVSSNIAAAWSNTSLPPGVNNHTNMTYFPYYQHSLPVAASYILAYLFIFLLCMVGNILVFLIVLGNHRMRTVTNLFILNLAVSDLLVGIFCIPTTLVDNLITGWPFTNTVCKMSGLVQGMSVSASVFTLVAIAVDRFRCIVYPFQPKLTLLVAKATIILIWLLAVVIMCPSAVALTVEKVPFHYMVYKEDLNATYPLYSCYENFADPEMRKVYTTVLFVHIYLVPLTLIMLMYGRIGVKLYTSVVSGREPQEPNLHARPESRPHISQKKIKVIKMLIVVALLFMLSWLPLWTLILMTDYAGLNRDQLDLLTSYIFPFAHWLAFSNSSVNPIIYGYYNENFKRGFQAVCQARPFCFLGMREQGIRKSKDVRLREGATGGCNLRDTSDPTPLAFGVRNKVYVDSNPTDTVRLELELKRSSRVGCIVHSERSCSEESAEKGDVTSKKGVTVEEPERLSPLGGGACQAWDN